MKKLNESELTQFLSGEVRKAIQLKRDAERTKSRDDVMYANGYYDGIYGALQRSMKI